jgi:hypothetical protein
MAVILHRRLENQETDGGFTVPVKLGSGCLSEVVARDPRADSSLTGCVAGGAISWTDVRKGASFSVGGTANGVQVQSTADVREPSMVLPGPPPNPNILHQTRCLFCKPFAPCRLALMFH